MPAKSKSVPFPLENVKPSTLKPHPRNYRQHPEDQLKHLMQSIREFGFYRNVIIARDGTILAGHGAVEAATALGLETIPVLRLAIEPDSAQAIKVLIGDNEIEHLAVQDDRLLSDLLKEIHTDLDLLGTGYDDMMLAALVMNTRPAAEITDFDEATHWVGMPDYDSDAPDFQVVIHCPDQAAVVQLLQVLNVSKNVIQVNSRKTIFHWPDPSHLDLRSVAFTTNGESS
jgi:ParB-like nuclease family protein